MNINLLNVENGLNKLKKIEDDYLDIYLNYYNQMNIIKDNWHSKKSKIFFETIDEEKQELNNILFNIKEINNVYKYILDKYKQIGNKIYYNNKNRKKITNKITNIISKIDKLINNYQYVIVMQEYSSIIEENKNKLLKIKRNIKTINEKNIEIENKIIEIEKEIKQKISKINLDYIKEKEINY